MVPWFHLSQRPKGHLDQLLQSRRLSLTDNIPVHSTVIQPKIGVIDDIHGHLLSSAMSRFDSAHTTSYSLWPLYSAAVATFFFCLPILSSHRLDVYHTSTQDVALVQI